MRWLIGVLVFVTSLLLRLRYRIRVVGKKALLSLPQGQGVLFLPNHPAEIDPIVLMSLVWWQFLLRPLVIDHFYRLKGVRPLMKALRAVSLPTMDQQLSPFRVRRVRQCFHMVAEALRQGDSFLIYPAGRLKLGEKEELAGASLVYDLLQEGSAVTIVLVRTTGLWGSAFSRAQTGAVPPFGSTLWRMIVRVLGNGVFFSPRRDVCVEFALAPQELLRMRGKVAFNEFLERWYNEVRDPLCLVPYSIWSQLVPEVAIPSSLPVEEGNRGSGVPMLVRERVVKEIAKRSLRSVEQILPEMDLSQDLRIDSLDLMELYLFLEEEFGVSGIVPGQWRTVEDFCQAAAGHQHVVDGVELQSKISPQWWKSRGKECPFIPPGETVIEVFLRRCEISGSKIACLGEREECLSYAVLKRRVWVLARVLKRLASHHVGVLLPSGATTYVVILALQLAGKVPVMLNWTAGPRALDHALRVANVTCVLSSEKFLDRIGSLDLGEVLDHLVLLEEVSFSWQDCLLGWGRSHFSFSSRTQDPAVILFTSGTETLPKAVPLSHHNILSNQRAAFSCVEFSAEDSFYGILPPFHSFGFSVTGLLPLLAGLKVCYSPDPTDARRLSREIALYQPTVFCSAPSFFKALFHIAHPDELRSLRFIVSGAERASQELLDYVEKYLPDAQWQEGYGITECGPIVAIGDGHRGMGKLIPEVEVVIIDPETLQQVVMPGEEGEICIRGPGVFAGYLGKTESSPFLKIGERSYYRSGDLGKMEWDGSLLLLGRLKRFIKMGGEMVSLGGIEEELLRVAYDKKWVKSQGGLPPLAVSFREDGEGRPQIVAFVTFPVSREELNASLRESGISRLIKISLVELIAEIPLTGTGKTHYRILDDRPLCIT